MKSVLFAFALSLSSPSMASDNHNHEAAVEPAPHGGILRDAPPYKCELVINGENAAIYIYDKDLKPAKLEAKTLVGQLRFPKAKKEQKITFKRDADSFKAAINGISKVHRFDLHVTLTEGGKKTVIDFGIDNIH